MTYYDEQLQMYRQQIDKKAHLESMLNDLYNQRRELDRKVIRLKVEKQIEQADVDKLESHSLTTFFYSVIGKKNQKLDKEKQEAYAAAMKYDVAVREFDAVEEEIKRCNKELSLLRESEKMYETAFREKKEVIKKANTPKADEMMRFEEKISEYNNQKNEINEAISEGYKALSFVDIILSHLKSADVWGTADLLGGGTISGISKHFALDDAQKAVEQFQIQLRRFKTELADVTFSANIQVNIDGFLRFADYFFDGIIVDLEILNRIQDSRLKVKAVQKQIKNVLNNLERKLSLIENEQQKTRERLENLVLSANIVG